MVWILCDEGTHPSSMVAQAGGRTCLSLSFPVPGDSLYRFSRLEPVVFIDFWKLSCQTLLKYQSKIVEVTLGSHCPPKVSARILTVPPQHILYRSMK